MTTQFKEVFLYANLGQIQHLAPDGRYLFFDLVAGCGMCDRWALGLELLQQRLVLPGLEALTQ